MTEALLSTAAIYESITEEQCMAVGVGFFDETTDSEELDGTTYTVAGFIANNKVTAHLELRWNCLLKKHKLRYFKASECNAGLGEFLQYRDDPPPQQWRKFSEREKAVFDQIKTDFTDVIVDFADEMNGIGAVVILPDYQQLINDYSLAKTTLLQPYYHCAQTVLMEAGLMVHRENRDRKYAEPYVLRLRPVFDSHEAYSGRMKQIFDSFCKRNPLSSKYLLPLHYESDQLYTSLQVADNIAFEVRKYVVSTLGGNRPMRTSLERILGLFWRVYKLDYRALKILVDEGAQDFNPIEPLLYTLDEITG
jgi:hypothetical protein